MDSRVKTWWLVSIVWALAGASVFFWAVAVLRRALIKDIPTRVVVQGLLDEHSYYPFPAVTICSQIKFKGNTSMQSSVNPVVLATLEPEEFYDVANKSLLCDQHIQVNGSKFSPDVIENIKKMAPPFDEILLACTWRNSIVKCQDIFKETLTDEGVCYTSNMLPPSEIYADNVIVGYGNETWPSENDHWHLETGYMTAQLSDAYPRAAITQGPRYGLNFIMLSHLASHNHVCKGALQGFKVLLHNPAEIPTMESSFIRVPVDREVMLAVKPQVIETSTHVQLYMPLSKRNCFFNGEKKLAYFKIYTRKNCELECSTNHTLKLCGCVSFHMPRLSKDTPLCGSGSKKCMVDTLHMVKQLNVVSECNCLPECNTVQYHVESVSSELFWMKVISAYEAEPKPFEGYSMSRATIYIKDMQLIKELRTEEYEQLPPVNGVTGDALLLLITIMLALIFILNYAVYLTLNSPTMGEELLSNNRSI